MDSNKWSRGSRDEDPDLVEEVIKRVELSICGERDARTQGIEQRRRNALVDGVFCDVDQEEG